MTGHNAEALVSVRPIRGDSVSFVAAWFMNGGEYLFFGYIQL